MRLSNLPYDYQAHDYQNGLRLLSHPGAGLPRSGRGRCRRCGPAGVCPAALCPPSSGAAPPRPSCEPYKCAVRRLRVRGIHLYHKRQNALKSQLNGFCGACAPGLYCIATAPAQLPGLSVRYLSNAARTNTGSRTINNTTNTLTTSDPSANVAAGLPLLTHSRRRRGTRRPRRARSTPMPTRWRE